MRKRDAFDPMFKAIRPAVLERDKNQCAKCGYAASIEVHHVNGYEDCRFEMLRTLCYRCHLIAPMGEEYWEWEKSGQNGWESAVDFIVKKTPDASRDLVIEVLRLIDPALDKRRKTLAADARRSIRKSTGRCEGQKPYGHHATEAEPLRFICEKAGQGHTPTDIAKILNADGVPSRRGAKWYPMVVSRILAAHPPLCAVK